MRIQIHRRIPIEQIMDATRSGIAWQQTPVTRQRNRSHFNLFYDSYFSHAFRRSLFPDADMTTPKQVIYKLQRYARRHPEMQLNAPGIDQIPAIAAKAI